MPRGYPNKNDVSKVFGTGYQSEQASRNISGEGTSAIIEGLELGQRKQEILDRLGNADDDNWTDQQKKMLGLIGTIGMAFRDTGGSWVQFVQVMHKACDIAEIVPEAMQLSERGSPLSAAASFFVPINKD